MKIIDNVSVTLKDDLSAEIKEGARLSIAAASFSIFAFQELKKELESLAELRFIFTSPTFTTEKTKKTQREFYIPRLNRERALYGSEFEVKLRNELTQKAIAKECADWIRGKTQFRSNNTQEMMAGFICLENGGQATAYNAINGFTTVELGCERGNSSYTLINKIDAPESRHYVRIFDEIWSNKEKMQDVTEEVIESISNAYKENPAEFIYFIALYNIFSTFLEDLNEDELPNEMTGFKESAIWGKLFHFQKDAALAIINKLERYNGCILADSVGLGKTFTALAVIKYYENRNKSVLVLCPKKLSENWTTFKSNYRNNPVIKDRLRYDVLFHTDLSRETGSSNGLDLSRINWGNYDLVVIDESHNFRNGGDVSESEDENGRDNRYSRLLKRVIRQGVKTKVLMLSATPVNNRFFDLRNQLQLAYEGNENNINDKLKTDKSIDEIFRLAQKSFNAWGKKEVVQRTTESLLEMLDFDFFELLDSVTIARSRKHIEKYYDTKAIGKFPERLKPISETPHLTDLENAINYNEIYEQIVLLNLSIYTPSKYIHESKIHGYQIEGEKNLTTEGRERGLRRLMSINLLKRLESSVHSFRLTLERVRHSIDVTISQIDEHKPGGKVFQEDLTQYSNEFDEDDQNMDLLSAGKKMQFHFSDMDHVSWRRDLVHDRDILDLLLGMVGDITPEHDNKLQRLLACMKNKQEKPINEGNKKIIVFTAFTDTAHYLYEHVSRYAKEQFNLDTAMVSGTGNCKTTVKGIQSDFNTILTCFSPQSKEKTLLFPDTPSEIDILIATDCISEGQNLQDCDYLINYDIHWNPVRIIQRFGRIDRIGSKNKIIQLVNFWPDLSLDEYINLKNRVETRMKITVMTSTGDDNLLDEREKGELEYRKQQLQRLQEEVVDIEDMQTGVSIMDLGLNEFRLDLLEQIKTNPHIENAPHGLHALTHAVDDTSAGVIYVLKNINEEININRYNRLHPFYMIYVSMGGEVVCNHLSPKKLLDLMRLLCRGKTSPDLSLCRAFNKETKDGRAMQRYSDLLQSAIASIVQAKEENEIDSLFKSGGTTALQSSIKGLDDFELICFLVIR